MTVQYQHSSYTNSPAINALPIWGNNNKKQDYVTKIITL
jgi:hypothetical protein